ncbi:hypothetical protein [Streptococcus sanguinis]|uniref:hypothetical protein n=2 Tax=Streptococcus sanguinis TaxID=1305 RepID=UPI0039900488
MVPTTICCSNSFLAHPMFVRTDGAEIVHEISPEQLKNSQLTPGLLEVFSRKDSGGLPPLPGHDTITHLHTGKFGDEGQ